jgi:hypothetical protein
MKQLVKYIVALTCILPALSCSSTPDLAPATNTDTFTGSVDVGNEDFHNFSVTKTGNVTVTLTQAGPPATITVGLGVGIPDGSGCPVAPNATVTAFGSTTPQLAGTLAAGTYCVDVFDVGNQSAPITYSLTVLHP